MKPKARGNDQDTAYKRGSTWTAQVVIGWNEGTAHPIPIKRTKGGFKTKKRRILRCDGNVIYVDFGRKDDSP